MARTKHQGNGRLEDVVADLAASQARLSQAQERLSQSHDRLAQAQESLVAAQAGMVQAHATLAHAQATLLAEMVDLERRFAETNRINSERFARIEAILMEHSRILHALPDAIRDKIGFKMPTQAQ